MNKLSYTNINEFHMLHFKALHHFVKTEMNSLMCYLRQS